MSLLSDSLGRKEIPCPIEKKEAVEVLRSHEALILAYPIQYSNLPDIVRVFIEQNRECWRGKQVFLMATMGLFSGDGTGVAARLLKKYGAVVTGGVHIRMPDSVADVKTLIKPEKENRQIVAAAGEKVRRTAERIKQGKMPRQGLGVFSHLLGLFGQRLYFWNAAQKYKNALKIDTKKMHGLRAVRGMLSEGKSFYEREDPASERKLYDVLSVYQCLPRTGDHPDRQRSGGTDMH